MNSGGSGGNGNISSSNLSILRRTLSTPRPRFALLCFENPQLGPPIRQRQAQSLDIGIAGEKLRLDRCDLAAAAFHSRGNLDTLGFDLLEGPAIAVQRGLLSGEVLPAGHGHIDVGWLQLQCKRDSRFFLAGDDRGPGPRRGGKSRSN
jgi:hypothetical protein